jgi:hypothetical protein
MSNDLSSSSNLDRYGELSDLVYRKIQFNLHGDDLISAHRFFKNLSPGMLGAIRFCDIYWKASLPMFIRGLPQYSNVGVKRTDLAFVEARWNSIAKLLMPLPLSSLARLQMKGGWGSSDIDISAHSNAIADNLRRVTSEAAGIKRRFGGYGESVCYRLIIRFSGHWDKDTTVRMIPSNV